MQTPKIFSRVVIIGDSLVGKTSILNKSVFDGLNQDGKTTVALNYHMILKEIQGIKVEMQIWDTAGTERYRSLSKICFRDANAGIIVYDQSKRKSFQNLQYWIDEFVDVAGNSALIVIVANKSDLEPEVQFREAETWTNNRNIPIRQTSAKTGEGINELFNDLAYLIVKNPQNVLVESKKSTKNITKKSTSCC